MEFKQSLVILIGYTQLVSLMLFVQLIKMRIGWTFKMLLLKQYLFILWQKKLIQRTKLLLHVYAKNYASVAKITFNVYSIVIWQDKILVMQVK